MNPSNTWADPPLRTEVVSSVPSLKGVPATLLKIANVIMLY